MFDCSEPGRGGGGPGEGPLPPSRRDLEEIAVAALSHLSPEARAMISGLSLLVKEAPDESTLSELGVSDPFQLLGRYDETSGAPRMTLYRRPILDYWAECGAPLTEVVFDILIAELDALSQDEPDEAVLGDTADAAQLATEWLKALVRGRNAQHGDHAER